MKKTWPFPMRLSVSTILSALFLVAGSSLEGDIITTKPAIAAEQNLEKPGVPGPRIMQPTKGSIVQSYGKLPLSFVENQGQMDQQVKYYSQGRGHSIYFTPDEVVLSLHELPSLPAQDRAGPNTNDPSPTAEPLRSAIARLTPEGLGKDAEVTALEPQEGRVNYFIGNDPENWRTDIPTYGAVLYREAFPGIDLKFYGAGRQLEYDIIVKPGADPRKARFKYSGIQKLALSKEGDLRIILPGGLEFCQKKPVVYQEINGRRVARKGRFLLGKKHGAALSYGFEVAAYNRQHLLIIDPPVLIYSTFLGGSGGTVWPGTDYAEAIAADANGNAYITGQTFSDNFPSKNPLQASRHGVADCFITKINAAGTAIVYSTFLGGKGSESAQSIAVDANGNAYVAGITGSTDFPVKNAFQSTLKSDPDAFVAKLNASGNTLVYSTYLGGSRVDRAWGIAVDASGSAYVSGETNSGYWKAVNDFVTDFPLKNPLDSILGTSYWGGANYDAFVTKFSPDGKSLVYSTFLGGDMWEERPRIAVDNAGNAYVVGTTASFDFPVKNFYQGSLKPDPSYNYPFGIDVFLTKINAAGSQLVYSTYLGGTLIDRGWGVAVDNGGGVYICGFTESTDFPTKNALQPSAGMNDDGFVTKFTENALNFLDLDYSTYLGGTSWDYCYGIAADDYGNAYVTGKTSSTLTFPTHDPIQASGKGACDTFVAMIDPLGQFVYSTQLGGSSADGGHGIAVDKKYNVYVAGETQSASFPTKVPLQPTKGAGIDAFVLKIAPKIPAGGLMAFFPLNGDAKDVSGNQRHGQIHRAGRTKDGYEGGAFYFNGTNSYIQAPVYINADESPRLTVGAWVKVSEKAVARRKIRQVISNDDGGFDRSLGLDYRSGEFGWSAFSGDNGVLGSLPITSNKWTFVAVVYDQLGGRGHGNVRLHVDGQVIRGPGILGHGLDFIHIGANPTFGEHFQGCIDNVFIFDWALSRKQIEHIRKKGAAGILSLKQP
jgi:hypothetical protein